MKIVIIEAYSAANVGSGALVENSVGLIKKVFPGAEIEILAQNPPSIHKLTGLPCFHELLSLPLGQSRIRQAGWLLRTLLWMSSHAGAVFFGKTGISLPWFFYTYDGKTRTALKKIKAADMVVSVGAERINDNFYKAILFSLYMLWVVQGFNKFLVLFPQTIGPFHFRVTRLLSAGILKRCHVLFLRDHQSRRIVSDMGVSGPVIVETCDVAVLQPAVSQEIAWSLLERFVPGRESVPLIGISAMKWDYIKAKGKSGYEVYKQAIAVVADEFIEEKGAHVIFIATNVLTEGCREDDVAACGDIVRLMKHQKKTTILNEVYTPSEMKGIMGLFEMALVTRMHACIFSTGIFTPTLSINYQFKLKEYMSLMGLGAYTVDIDVVTVDKLRKLMNQGWENRSVNREILRGRVFMWGNQLEREMGRLPEYYRSWKIRRPISEG